jgi:hypothetical protein
MAVVSNDSPRTLRRTIRRHSLRTADPSGPSLFVTTAATGRSEVAHQETNPNVLAGAMVAARRQNYLENRRVWRLLQRLSRPLCEAYGPRQRRSANRLNPDGSGFEELTAGTDTNAFPSFAPRRKALRLPHGRCRWLWVAHHEPPPLSGSQPFGIERCKSESLLCTKMARNQSYRNS